MIRKIPFNPVTALAAWEFPSEDGVFYLLFMRNGTPVKPIAYYDEAGTAFPFVGDYWTHEFGTEIPTFKHDIWTEKGQNLRWMTSMKDLVLYRGTLTK